MGGNSATGSTETTAGMPVPRRDPMDVAEELAALAAERRSRRFPKPAEGRATRASLEQSQRGEEPHLFRAAPQDSHQHEMLDQQRERHMDPTHRTSQKSRWSRPPFWEQFTSEEPPSELDFIDSLLSIPPWDGKFSPEERAEIDRRKRALTYGFDTMVRGVASSLTPGANEFAAAMDALFGHGDYEANLGAQRARDLYDAKHFPGTTIAAQLLPVFLLRRRDLGHEILDGVMQELLSKRLQGHNALNKQQPWHRTVVVQPKKK